MVNDLFFEAKIGEVLRSLGVPACFAKSNQGLEKRLAEGRPALALVDLGARGVDPLLAIQYIRTDAEHGGLNVPVVAFVAHVLRGEAEAVRELGVVEIYAKSQLVRYLPEMVKRFAGHLVGTAAATTKEKTP